MSRSGYTEDYDELFPNSLALYRRNVERTIDGKRGQAFLRDLLTALDGMPVKRLISDSLALDGEVCAIGALGRFRGVDMQDIDPEDAPLIGRTFGITEILAREVVFENDEGVWSSETPEERWQRMRSWVATHIKSTPVTEA